MVLYKHLCEEMVNIYHREFLRESGTLSKAAKSTQQRSTPTAFGMFEPHTCRHTALSVRRLMQTTAHHIILEQVSIGDILSRGGIISH